MTDLATNLSLWTLEPWLPLGGLLLLLAAVFLVASYAWRSRPSGRTGTERNSTFKRLASLVILAFPLLVLLGLIQLLYPLAAPETLVLRSRALRPGPFPAHIPTTHPCLNEVFDRLTRGAPEPPACLTNFLPNGDDSAATREAVRRALLHMASGPRLSTREILAESPAFKAWITEIASNAVAKPPVTRSAKTEAELAKALAEALVVRVRLWPLASASTPVDAGPVVDHALALFDASAFTELDYRSANTDLVTALQSAVERAVATVAPRPLSGSLPPPPPSPRPDTRPDVVEAIEAAVFRLLVANRNVRVGIVERHRRQDEDASVNAWRRLRQTLLDADSTATGKPVGLVLLPGSVSASAAYLDVVGKPWLRTTSTGERIVHAQLRLGEIPHPSWKLALEDDTGGTLSFQCLVPGRATAGTVPAHTQRLNDCLPGTVALRPGQSVVLSLRLGNKATTLPPAMRLRVVYSAGVQPLLRNVEIHPPDSVSIVTSTRDWALRGTLSCLLDRGSAVTNVESIRRFRRALVEGGKAPVELGPVRSPSPSADGVVVTLGPEKGIWIHPEGIDWSRIEKDVVRQGLVRQRAVPIGHLLARGADMYGTSLFPAAFAGPGLPDGIDRLIATPLVPTRNAPLTPGTDPAESLIEPRSARIMLSYAEPVAFSALPMLRSAGYLNVFALSAAPLVWRLDVPASSSGPGGIVWYFDLDPEIQGLLLPANCLPERKDVADFCRQPHEVVQSFEPPYDETRFFPFWLAVLRAARTSAVEWRDRTPSADQRLAVPVFMTNQMLLRAQVLSASSGLLMLVGGLAGHAVLLLALRLRQHRSSPVPRRRR